MTNSRAVAVRFARSPWVAQPVEQAGRRYTIELQRRSIVKSNDGRQLAAANEIRVLRALNRFGWLRTRDLAVLVWQRWAHRPTDEPCLAPLKATASNLRMAQRTLRRLLAQRMVLRAAGPDGSQIYAVSEPGARRLQDACLTASSGKDLIRSFSAGHFRHRCIANEVAIAGIVQGFKVSTEREVSRGLWAGGESGLAGKKPDVLLRAGRLWTWIEVERSRRNATDYTALLRWLAWVRPFVSATPRREVMPGAVVEKIVFVCTEAFERRLRADLSELGWRADEADKVIAYKTRLYTFQNINFGI